MSEIYNTTIPGYSTIKDELIAQEKMDGTNVANSKFVILEEEHGKMEKKKIEVIPYLSFNGDCEEAVNTYINAIGGEITYVSRWTEKTYDKMPEQIGKVMHMEFVIGSTRMAAGDNFDAREVKTDIKLMIHMDSEEEALHAISVLAEGGIRLSPLHPHPEPDDGGCGSATRDGLSSKYFPK